MPRKIIRAYCSYFSSLIFQCAPLNALKLSILIICSAFLLSCSANYSYIVSNKHNTSNKRIQNQSKCKKKTGSNKICKAKYRVISKGNIKKTKKNHIIGRDPSICKVRREPSFKKTQFAKLKGEVVVEKIKEKGNWIKAGFNEKNGNKKTARINDSDLKKTAKTSKNKIKLAQVKTKNNFEFDEDQLSPM